MKTAVFGANSSLPSSVSLFSAHLDAKQCTDSFQQPQACDPFPLMCFVAFRSSFICNLVLDLNSCGGNDPDGMFPFFTSR